LTIEQWGNIEWGSMENAFNGCSNLVLNAIDAPNLSNVTNMSGMFANATSFTGNVSMDTWEVSNVTNLSFMFAGQAGNVVPFNRNIDSWDVSNVTDMNSMFMSSLFNQNISRWVVSKVTNMNSMFASNTVFNQPLANWERAASRDVFESTLANVTVMANMFRLTCLVCLRQLFSTKTLVHGILRM